MYLAFIFDVYIKKSPLQQKQDIIENSLHFNGLHQKQDIIENSLHFNGHR